MDYRIDKEIFVTFQRCLRQISECGTLDFGDARGLDLEFRECAEAFGSARGLDFGMLKGWILEVLGDWNITES
jgi:hypothetical protein